MCIRDRPNSTLSEGEAASQLCACLFRETGYKASCVVQAASLDAPLHPSSKGSGYEWSSNIDAALTELSMLIENHRPWLQTIIRQHSPKEVLGTSFRRPPEAPLLSVINCVDAMRLKLASLYIQYNLFFVWHSQSGKPLAMLFFVPHSKIT